MVVEDNVVNQMVARGLLEQSGARVEIAVGGREGVQQALEADPPFDAILMDMQMPDVDGVTAARELLGHEFMRNIPIIAMTANAMAEDKEACLAVGMLDFVTKPIDLKELVNTLLRHIVR